jgi:catechol 2,3-dioxygenase-like lactoylglutathione lyase family enzyme
MTTTAVAPVRFHLSLNVSDLPRAVEFFERVLGAPTAKRRADYAKFELDSPPLVFSLEPRSPKAAESLNHIGFRFPDAESLVAAQRRLEAAGIATQREEGVECCYARQTKFWVHDLDQRLWEFYVLEGDLDHRGQGQTQDQVTGREAAIETKSERLSKSWEHRMGSPFQPPAEGCDQIRLRGTFNGPVVNGDMQERLTAAYRALRPGGELMVHVLTAEEPVAGELNLPGPAAYVKHVPVRSELMQAMEAAGFRQLQLTTFRSGACFEHRGVPLRETQIVARRPTPIADGECTVVYKGPFRGIIDDSGTVFRRGWPTVIAGSQWEALRNSSEAESFVELPAVAPASHCGG